MPEGFHEKLDIPKQVGLLPAKGVCFERRAACSQRLDGRLALFILGIQPLQQRQRLASRLVRALFLIDGERPPPIGNGKRRGSCAESRSLRREFSTHIGYFFQTVPERPHGLFFRQRLLLGIFEQKAHFPRGVFETSFRIVQQFVQGFHIDTFFHSSTSQKRKSSEFFYIIQSTIYAPFCIGIPTFPPQR